MGPPGAGCSRRLTQTKQPPANPARFSPDLTIDLSRQGRSGASKVISGAMGRRRRSVDDRARIVEETLVPGTVVSVVARRQSPHLSRPRSSTPSSRRATSPTSSPASSKATLKARSTTCFRGPMPLLHSRPWPENSAYPMACAKAPFCAGCQAVRLDVGGVNRRPVEDAAMPSQGLEHLQPQPRPTRE